VKRDQHQYKEASMRQKISILVAIAAVSFVSMGTAAWASGRSTPVNGCYAQWGNTGVSGYCEPATVTGRYRVHVDCKAPEVPDYDSSWQYVTKGSKKHFGQIDCAYGIHSARIEVAASP
jgi:hypothetical protein